MIETWVTAPGFEAYQVSNTGRIKNSMFILNPVINKDGYRQCLLLKGEQRKNVLLHRLIASAFIPNLQNLPQINHLDGNKLNNTVTNLEWCTPKRNTNHAIEIGLIDNGGENNHNHVLKDTQVLEIRKLFKEGIGTRSIARMYGVTRSAIQHIKKGRTRKGIIKTI